MIMFILVLTKGGPTDATSLLFTAMPYKQLSRTISVHLLCFIDWAPRTRATLLLDTLISSSKQIQVVERSK